jgi:hypothetical protein
LNGAGHRPIGVGVVHGRHGVVLDRGDGVGHDDALGAEVVGLNGGQLSESSPDLEAATPAAATAAAPATTPAIVLPEMPDVSLSPLESSTPGCTRRRG